MKRIVFSLILLSVISSLASAGFSKKIAEGNKLFDEESFEEALTKYNDAQIGNPSSPEIFFNMGTVYYRQKKYKASLDAFQKSMEKGDVELEAKALYNVGNSLFQQGQLREALRYYKQSLERNSDDKDTKYNIEYIERKIKEMLSKAQETKQKAKQEQARRRQQKQSGKNGKKAEGDKDKQQGSGADQAKEDEEREKDNGGKEESKDKSEQAQEGAGPEDKKGMTKEEAQRFLSAFDRDQKNLIPPEQQGSERGKGTYVEKDW